MLTSPNFRQRLEQIAEGERDAFLEREWGLGDLREDESELPNGCVPYLPCPVATVLRALELARVTREDVFVDVGSGAGKVVLLARLLTGAKCVGLEIQPALVANARACAERLNLAGISFVEGDAAGSARRVSDASVFFLYCPFSGARLDQLLGDLEAIARTRPIRICCVQMPPLDRPWLDQLPQTSAELHVYRSKIA